MIHCSVIICLTLAALAYSQHCPPPPDPHRYCIDSQGVDNCAPEDRRIFSSSDKCRTDLLLTNDHILPLEWELMFDSQDYLRSAFLSREFDNDGEDKVRYDYVTMLIS